MSEAETIRIADLFEGEAGAGVAEALRAGVEAGRLPSEVRIDPETVERDLVRLVLTLVEFIRQLLEAQAVRRMENGTLTPDEEERLGATLMRAREKIVEIAERLGLGADELTLDLGPLGRLV
ncbi:MAG: gas vesicle protein K [Parvularculaceae bacterium]